MKIVRCDRCCTDIDPSFTHGVIRHGTTTRTVHSGSSMPENTRHADLCPQCTGQFAAFLANTDVPAGVVL